MNRTTRQTGGHDRAAISSAAETENRTEYIDQQIDLAWPAEDVDKTSAGTASATTSTASRIFCQKWLSRRCGAVDEHAYVYQCVLTLRRTPITMPSTSSEYLRIYGDVYEQNEIQVSTGLARRQNATVNGRFADATAASGWTRQCPRGRGTTRSVVRVGNQGYHA